MRRKKVIILCALAGTALLCASLLRDLTGYYGKLQENKESAFPGEEISGADLGNIRVLIKTDGFAGIFHSEVRLTGEGAVILSWGKEGEKEALVLEPGEEVAIYPDDARLSDGTLAVVCGEEGGKITIASLTRGYGAPAYRGRLELSTSPEGIVMVNELSIESYLYGVVPSEMPSSYEMEALKAQAVCARSYAYHQSRSYAYPEYLAHVDDSTSFQVYGNSMEQERTTLAVSETCGEMVWYQGVVAATYYYSTSCGKSASISAWGGDLLIGKEYLQSIDIADEAGLAYEKDLPWYRWTATVSESVLQDLIECNTATKIGSLLALSVTKTGEGGIAQEITAVGSEGKVIVETENQIRRTLGGEGYEIEKQDGTVVKSTSLLPSAFITIEKKNGTYIIRGGGYGHGIGMSQNGANEMAKAGKNYREILETFYQGVTVK